MSPSLSSICVWNTLDASLYNNQFIYSPTSQIYAAGMLNNQFGIYKAYGYGNVTTQTIWKAPQSSTANECYFSLQVDRNLVVYTVVSKSVMWTAAVYNSGEGKPFCLQMFDSGNLVLIDNTTTIFWQTNTATIG
ncbi:hypothetical protein I4U23_015405 [Adineta vaga]|nr:hypothetical protein I4U23_015405 [Adineta vaga]